MFPQVLQTPSDRPQTTGCGACQDDSNAFPLELTMAFQPLVNTSSRTVYGYEALVRGVNGAGAGEILALVTPANRYSFDQACRVKSIELASRLGIAERGARLAVNFMPGAVYSPAACIRRTLEAARENGFPLDHIIFELTENEEVNPAHLQGIAKEYNRHGFTLALDDFGAGYSGLNLLATLEGIRLVKLDGTLVHAAARSQRAALIVASIASLCASLDIEVLGECVETPEHYAVLERCGIHLMQGFLFAKPATASLPSVYWPERAFQAPGSTTQGSPIDELRRGVPV